MRLSALDTENLHRNWNCWLDAIDSSKCAHPLSRSSCVNDTT